MVMKLKDLFTFVRGKIRVPYYYVPACPYCGCPATGRYVKMHLDTDTEWMINEALKNGELVKPLSEIGENNVFCLDCGHEWKYPISVRMISLDRLAEEKKKRLTVQILTQRLNEDRENEKKNAVKFKGIRRFINNIK